MFELGCHLIDLLIGILGKPDKVTPYNRHSGDYDDGLIDNMLAVCDYPGATATIRSTAVEVEGFERRHLLVCGTKGTLQIQPLDEPVAQLELSEPRGEYQPGYQTIKLARYQRYVDDLADLAAIVRGEKASDFDTEPPGLRKKRCRGRANCRFGCDSALQTSKVAHGARFYWPPQRNSCE